MAGGNVYNKSPPPPDADVLGGGGGDCFARDRGRDRGVSGGTVTAAIFGIVKAMVGPAILYLPRAFADAGYCFALIALWTALGMYLYASRSLLHAWRHAKSAKLKRLHSAQEVKVEMISLVSPEEGDDGPSAIAVEGSTSAEVDATERKSIETEGATGEALVDEDASVSGASYPRLARMAYGDAGERAVRAGIALMQLGVCLTYFIFVPHNLAASVEALSGARVPTRAFLAAMACVEVPLSSVRNVRALVRTNILATCLIAFGLAGCLRLALTTGSGDNAGEGPAEGRAGDDTGDGRDRHRLSPWNDRWYLFIGTSVLLFEGSITLCIPLQEALAGEDAPSVFPRVYARTINGIVAFYTFFGFLCWRSLGDDVSTVLTTSLPPGVLATTVQLAYSVAVVLTFPLQIFPALEIMACLVEDGLSLEMTSLQRVTFVSVVIASLSVIAEIEMDNLGRVVALMGSLLGCPLAFVFPPLIRAKIVPDVVIWRDHAVAGLGLLAMFGATSITLYTWSEPGVERK